MLAGKRMNLIALAIIMFLVIAAISISLPSKFLTLINFQSMTSQIPEFGLLSIAMMIALITGGIDLSVVSITNLTGVVSALILKTYPGEGSVFSVIFFAILVALVLSAFCGLINGFLIAHVGVPAILATLGTMGLYLGTAIIITEGHGIHTFPEKFLFIGSGTIGILPMPLIIFIGATIIIAIILRKTPLGMSMFMVGSNPIASRFSGINNSSVLMQTYIITGLLAGVSSIIMISRVNSIRPGYGYAYLLQAILVAVLGGTDVSGGYGSILGLVLGLIILQSLQSGFNILNFSPFFRKFIWGLMLLIVMVINYYINRYQSSARKSRKKVHILSEE
ncbi:MAG: ABC transporter permease [Spirochaetes bacterium]|nr:MAG: ABC transporter permease [Spirochaetota bacterium]